TRFSRDWSSDVCSSDLTCPAEETSRPRIWESAFPNHRHVFMTRRNKVRLAVSWWRAIQSGEWHVRTGESREPVDLSNAYSFDARSEERRVGKEGTAAST